MLEGSAPDLVITDINMPRLDRFGLIERIRNSDRYRAIPILAPTTENEPQKRKRARKAGATAGSSSLSKRPNLSTLWDG